jgi:hypothetical protein
MAKLRKAMPQKDRSGDHKEIKFGGLDFTLASKQGTLLLL